MFSDVSLCGLVQIYFMPEDGDSSFLRSEDLKLSCVSLAGVVPVALPGGTKSGVLRNVPLDVTAERLFGNHGKARLDTPSFGFVVVLKRSERVLSVLNNNLEERLFSLADSCSPAQAVPRLSRNSDGQQCVRLHHLAL